jgi:hypothetical protein
VALLLGLDIGTTSAKAVVFDEGGTVLGAGRARTPWFSSPDGVELRPADLIDIAVTALNQAVDATPGTAPTTLSASRAWGTSRSRPRDLAGKVRSRDLITAQYPLAQVAEAFAAASSGEQVKVLILA